MYTEMKLCRHGVGVPRGQRVRLLLALPPALPPLPHHETQMLELPARAQVLVLAAARGRGFVFLLGDGRRLFRASPAHASQFGGGAQEIIENVYYGCYVSTGSTLGVL